MIASMFKKMSVILVHCVYIVYKRLRKAYCIEILLVGILGAIKADDCSEKAKKATDIVCIAHPSFQIGISNKI
jgi:hypothetical protein